MVFLVSPWAFGQRKSYEYPWGIEFPLFKLGYLPPVFCWLVFEKIQAVVVFFNSMLNWRSELYFGLYYFRTTLATSVFWHRKWDNLWKYKIQNCGKCSDPLLILRTYPIVIYTKAAVELGLYETFMMNDFPSLAIDFIPGIDKYRIDTFILFLKTLNI